MLAYTYKSKGVFQFEQKARPQLLDAQDAIGKGEFVKHMLQ